MYCSNCGRPVVADAQACAHCGASPTVHAVHADTTQPVYAGFWRRFSACVVDGLLVTAVIVPFMLLVSLFPTSFWLVFVLQLALPWIYMAAMESSARQATLGKLALGIKVTGLDGQRISFGRATGRYFAKWLSSLPLLIGYVIAAFTGRKQALHDFVASTLVVRAGASSEEVRLGKGTMPMTAGVWITIGLYLLLFVGGIGAAVTIPAYQDYTVRSRIAEAMMEGARLQGNAAAEFDVPGAAEHEVAGTSRYLRRLIVRPHDRQIVMVLETPNVGTRLIPDGSSIRYTLQASGSWKCSADGVPERYLPGQCRRH